MTISNLVVDLKLSAKSYSNDLKKAQRETKAFEKEMAGITRLGKQFTNVGKTLTVGLTLPLAAAGAAAVKVAADAEESESKFRAVFKNMADDVSAWSEAHAEATNRSAIDLRDFASTLQDTFVPLGFMRGEAAEMSKSLVELGVDLASFNNRAEPEVIQNLTSAIVGNHEAVRSFGIVITQATLKQELMNMGIQGGVQAATEQQKAMARMNLIIKSTTDAQGDAARTAESFTNQAKGLSANIKDAGVAIGKIFMPPLTKLMEALNGLLDVFNGLSPEMRAFLVGTAAMAAAIGPLMFAIGHLLTALPALGLAIKALVLTGTAPVGLLIFGFGAIVAGLVAFRKEIQSVANDLASKLAGALSSVLSPIASVADAIGLDGMAGKLNSAIQSIDSAKQGFEFMAVEVLKDETALLDYNQALGATAGVLEQTAVAADTATVSVKALSDLDFFKPDYVARVTEGWRSGVNGLIELGNPNLVPTQLDRGIMKVKVTTEQLAVATQMAQGAVEYYVAGAVQGWEETSNAAIKSAADQEKAYNDLHNSIQKSFGQVFTAMLADGKNAMNKLGEYIKNVFFKILIQDVLGKIVADFTTGFVGKIQGAISSAVGGITGGVGGALGSIGSSAAVKGATGSVTSVGGSATSLASAAAGPAGIIASVGGGALGGFISGVMSRKADGIISGGVDEIKNLLRGFISVDLPNFARRFESIEAAIRVGRPSTGQIQSLYTPDNGIQSGAPSQQGVSVGEDIRGIRALLRQVLAQQQSDSGKEIMMDGEKVARIQARHLHDLTRDEGMQVVGAR